MPHSLDECERGLDDAVEEYQLGWPKIRKIRSMAWPGGEKFYFRVFSRKFDNDVLAEYQEIQNVATIRLIRVLYGEKTMA